MLESCLTADQAMHHFPLLRQQYECSLEIILLIPSKALHCNKTTCNALKSVIAESRTRPRLNVCSNFARDKRATTLSLYLLFCGIAQKHVWNDAAFQCNEIFGLLTIYILLPARSRSRVS